MLDFHNFCNTKGSGTFSKCEPFDCSFKYFKIKVLVGNVKCGTLYKHNFEDFYVIKLYGRYGTLILFMSLTKWVTYEAERRGPAFPVFFP